MDAHLAGPSLAAAAGPTAHPPSPTVRLTGELDLATGARVAEQLRQAFEHWRCVVVDLRALSFMDVAGMRVLLDADGDARERGRHLVMVRGPAHIDALFSLTGNGELIDTVDPSSDTTAEDAVVSVARRTADRAWRQPAASASPAEGADSMQAFLDHVEDVVEQRVEARLQSHLDVLAPAASPRLAAVPSALGAAGA